MSEKYNCVSKNDEKHFIEGVVQKRRIGYRCVWLFEAQLEF